MGKKTIDIKNLIESRSLTIKDLILYIKSKLLFVLIVMAIFGGLGLLKGISVTDEFTSSSQLIPENPMPNNNNLFNIGSMLPNNIKQGGGAPLTAVPVELYPKIVLSDNFLYDLIEREYFFADIGREISLQDYFQSFYEEDFLEKTKKWPSQLISSFMTKKSEAKDTSGRNQFMVKEQSDTLINRVTVLNFTGKERKAIASLKARITIIKTDQFFELQTMMPDPNVAAIFNKDIVEKLINFVGGRQTEKETTNFSFLREQQKISEVRYKQAEAALAHYKDRNRGLISNQAKSIENQLRNEYELSYTLYNQLSQQMEVARVKLEEARPIITILQNPIVPNMKINPGPMGVTIIFSIAGAFIAFAFIGVRIFIYFINNWLNG